MEKNKRALSQVVSVVLLILLTIVAIGIIWATINTFVLNKLKSTESCYGITDKVSLNNDWTCYNASGEEFLFSINVKEIDLDAIVISIVNFEGTSSEVRRINNVSSIVENVTYLGGSSSDISIPGKESGKTYVLHNVTSMPNEISIAPIISEKYCEITDKIETIYVC